MVVDPTLTILGVKQNLRYRESNADVPGGFQISQIVSPNAQDPEALVLVGFEVLHSGSQWQIRFLLR